jgi:hypothetical protein
MRSREKEEKPLKLAISGLLKGSRRDKTYEATVDVSGETTLNQLWRKLYGNKSLYSLN